VDNYQFCAHWVAAQRAGKNIRILDYGCGAGKIVRLLRDSALNAFGCDVFYDAADYSQVMNDESVLRGWVRQMHDGVIPFSDASFDIVVNNQVMEHVEDLEVVLAEIHRVLRPGGLLLSLFPDRGVWREGHCGIPFLHWFPKYSRPRIYYAAGLRLMGFGYHKGTVGAMAWSKGTCNWLDKWTFYRTKGEIRKGFCQYFVDIRHIEDYWLDLRVRERYGWMAGLPGSVKIRLVQKLGGMVFVARKPDA
jgi:SAM-dependent methyltransferase